MSPESARTQRPNVTNEDRYRALLQSLSTFVWVADAQGRFLVRQPGWEEYTGHGFDQHGGDGWISDVHPDDRAHVTEVWTNAVHSKSWYEVAWRCWHGASKNWRQCMTRGVPVIDEVGCVREWIGAVLDIDDRLDAEMRRSQTDLTHSNQKLADNLEVMTRLHQLSTRLIQSGELDELNVLLGEIIEAAVDLTRADKGNIQLFRNGALRIIEHRGFHAAFLNFFNNVEEETAACGTALARKERVIIEDVAASPVFVGTPALDVMLAAGVRAVQSTPLFSRSGRLVGILSTHYSSPQAPSERDLRVLDMLARQTADLIERSLADQELRESRTTLAAALASMTDAVFISDAEGRIIHMNDAFATYHRYKNHEDASKHLNNCADLLPAFLPDGSEVPLQMGAIPRALRGEAASNVEYTLQRTDTGETWVGSYSFSPIRDKDGAIVGSVVAARDITERKREEERFRSLVSQSLAGIAECNPDGTFISVNDHFCKITGFAREELLTMRKQDITHPEDRPWNLELFRRCVEQGQSFDIEKRYVRKDGSSVWVHNSVSPVSDPGGRLRSIVMICLDISDRKAAEATMVRSERTLSELVERAPFGIYIVDSRFCITHMNTASQNGAFRNVRPVIGRDFGEAMRILWPQAVAAEIIAAFRHTLETGEPYYSERFVNPRRDTATVEAYEWELHRMTLPDGKPGVICYYFDSTELRNAEAELVRANKDLEQFAYSASHDLQEPIRSIKIYSELLAVTCREKLNGEALEALDFVRTAAARMELLLRGLLAYTQASLCEGSAEPVDAGKVLDAAVESLTGAILESRAMIHAGALPAVRIHSTQLQQLFQNLIGNAIKYRKEGVPPSIQVSAERLNGEWRFAVQDNGIGIEEEYKHRVFGLFKRLHTHDEYAGAGIGLAICHRIVEQHKGRIWVESRPGEGSTFYFTLPA